MKTIVAFEFQYEIDKTEKGTFALSLISGCNIKKIPDTTKLSDEQFLTKWLNGLNFKARYAKVLQKMKPAELSLVKDKEIKGVRVCEFKEKSGKEWINNVIFELVYSDNMAIKIDETTYYAFDIKLDRKFSNY